MIVLFRLMFRPKIQRNAKVGKFSPQAKKSMRNIWFQEGGELVIRGLVDDLPTRFK
jgi:hypothetical protein